MSGFEQALAAVRDVEGWLTDAQAQTLWNRAQVLPAGSQIAEIGSFRGRSAIVRALGSEGRAALTAIDPHAGGDRGPRQIEADSAAGEDDNQAFNANLARAGVAGVVRHLRLPSAEAMREVDGELDLLYVDGAHRYGPALADVRDWGARVRPGGRMLVHDAFSSIGVTLALFRSTVFSRGWRYAGRAGTLVEYVREPAGASSALRQVALLPWFAWNVVLKVLTLLKIRRGPWPH